MTEPTSYARPGFTSVTPYLIVHDAAAAIEFYRKAFDATELMRHADADGRIAHAEVAILGSPIMLGGESPDWPAWQSPLKRGGSPVHIYLYVRDADAAVKKAIAAGASELLPVKDQPYGERSGGVTDPFGHIWYLSTYTAKVSGEFAKA